MDTDSDFIENIKACRTCGIHYVTPSKHQLKHLFQSSLEHSEMMLIRLELSQWNVEVAENDGFPQYVCNTCIHKFDQVFKLRAACINAQSEFRKFYAVPNGNIPSVKVKTERPDPVEEQAICDFIYVDDLSDEEYDGATPFNFPHIPIKEEIIEAATIPMEDSEQPSNMVESASREVVHTPTSPSSHISELMSHSESVAATQPPDAAQIAVDKIECKLCQHLSPNQEEHERHMQRAHETRDFECHVCGKEFKNCTSSRLKFHMKWHTLNKHVKCNLCGFMCNSKEALREHKRANHRKLNCKICEKSILARKMKSHLRQHELIPKYSCEYCTEAFATENERENHIWQIHANEDNTTAPNLIPTFQATCSQTDNEKHFKVPEEVLCQEPQEDILYKFMCAHCQDRFIEQVDLETHVNEEHRNKSHLASVSSVAGIEGVPINETAEIAQNENVNDNDNIKVFEEYDNDNEIHILANNDSSLTNIPTIAPEDFGFPSTSSNFLNQTETAQNDESDIAANTSSLGRSEETESEDETNSNLPSYIASSLNTFACAKCSETFISIEQLRQHHEQHLATDQQPQKQKASTNKLKFTCNLCGKTFDLKFSLNRHIKKHKHAPI